MTKKERYQHIIKYFSKHMPDADTELKYNSPYELLVAVILSAQCTDKRVNLITPSFFRHFPDITSLSRAGYDEVYKLIKSCSYPNTKSRYLVDSAKMICKQYHGKIPSSPEKLQLLPGVGRKTANVLSVVLHHAPVFPVDTHVFRVAARIGLTYKAKNVLMAEQQLTKAFPKKIIPMAHHWLILHGRYVCKARKPLCEECGIKKYCKYYATDRLK